MFKERCKNELNKTRFITYKTKNKSKQPKHLVKKPEKKKVFILLINSKSLT